MKFYYLNHVIQKKGKGEDEENENKRMDTNVLCNNVSNVQSVYNLILYVNPFLHETPNGAMPFNWHKLVLRPYIFLLQSY